MRRFIAFLLLATSAQVVRDPATGVDQLLSTEPVDGDPIHAIAEQSLPRSERYTYPQFLEGRVTMFNQKIEEGLLLNFDRYLSTIVALNADKDTMLLKPFSGIRYATIGDDVYYYHFDHGFLRLLNSHSDTLRLASRPYLKLIASRFVEKPSKKIPGPNRFMVTAVVGNPPNNVCEWIYERKSYIIFIDSRERIYRASRRQVIHYFPGQKKQIKQYMKELAQQGQPIRFDDEKDVSDLMQFCWRAKAAVGDQNKSN